MRLSVEEFIRLHVLPKRFMRIRHYGPSPIATAPSTCRLSGRP